MPDGVTATATHCKREVLAERVTLEAWNTLLVRDIAILFNCRTVIRKDATATAYSVRCHTMSVTGRYAQVRVVFEEHTEQVPNLALVPICI